MACLVTRLALASAFMLAVTGPTGCTPALPLEMGPQTRAETISFRSETPTHQELLRGVLGRTPAAISGDLRLPDASVRLPVVIIIHGSDGITRGERFWADELVKIGVAAFVVDSFSGRGITETFSDQTRLTNLAMIADAYRALEELAAHPRIDPARIALMGFSKGGWVALYASFRRFQRMYGRAGLEFATHIAFYPSCTLRFAGSADMTDRPVRIFNGEADDQSLFSTCLDFVERLRQAGKDVQIVGFPGAHHAFDNPQAGPVRRYPAWQNFSRCVVDESRRPPDMNAWLSACRSQGVTLGYDARAQAEASQKLVTFLTSVFALGRQHGRLEAPAARPRLKP